MKPTKKRRTEKTVNRERAPVLVETVNVGAGMDLSPATSCPPPAMVRCRACGKEIAAAEADQGKARLHAPGCRLGRRTVFARVVRDALE